MIRVVIACIERGGLCMLLCRALLVHGCVGMISSMQAISFMICNWTGQLDRPDRTSKETYVDTHVLLSLQMASDSIWSGFHLQHS